MNNKLKLVLSLPLILLASACSTMHFTQGPMQTESAMQAVQTDTQPSQAGEINLKADEKKSQELVERSETVTTDSKKTTKTVSHWHHSMLNGVIEISKPTNLYKDCRGKPWQKVTVEFQFGKSVAGLAMNSVLNIILLPIDFLAYYSPWAVDVECQQ